MLNRHCKLPAPRRGSASARAACAGLSACAAGLLLATCCARPARRTITLEALEAGRAVPPRHARRAVLADLRPLGELYHPLARRLGLLRVASAADWQRLARVVPELGPHPDLRRGLVVGLVSRAGLALDGAWPISLQGARLCEGAGLLEGHFHPGSYYPDGAACVELAFVEGLQAVLVLDIDGVRFYPRRQAGRQALAAIDLGGRARQNPPDRRLVSLQEERHEQRNDRPRADQDRTHQTADQRRVVRRRQRQDLPNRQSGH